jgi:hypothetical protein
MSLPFPPAYAADQKEITFNSLWQEINQFQQLGGHQNYKFQLLGRRHELEILKASFERAEILYSKRQISLSEYSRRKVAYQTAQLRAEEMESKVAMMRDYAEIAKLGIVDQGDPDVDLRGDIARKMKDTLLHQRTTRRRLKVRRLRCCAPQWHMSGDAHRKNSRKGATDGHTRTTSAGGNGAGHRALA